MLTRDDLQAIREILKVETDPIRDDVAGMKKDMSRLKRNVSKIKKDIDVIIRSFDRDNIELRKDVSSIKDHIGSHGN